MSTVEIAISLVEKKQLPFWKLYKGKEKIAQCDKEENPDARTDIALQQFQEEIETRLNSPGNYLVNIYRAHKGDKGGSKYEFSISANDHMSNTFPGRSNPLSFDEIYQRAKMDLETQASLKRIEDKLDAIGDFILSKTTDDKKDDNEALKLLVGLFGTMKNKATPAIAKTGFSSLS